MNDARRPEAEAAGSDADAIAALRAENARLRARLDAAQRSLRALRGDGLAVSVGINTDQPDELKPSRDAGRATGPGAAAATPSADRQLLEQSREAALQMLGEAVQARREAERVSARLLASEARYRELVHDANSAIVRWRSDGTISFVNEYAQGFFGYRADELVGQHVGVLLADLETTGIELVQGIIANPEQHIHQENENLCRDGRRVWMSWTNKAVRDAHGWVVEVLAVGSDITQRKRAEQALREADRRKDAFLATLAHELRNPLTPIGNAAYLLGLQLADDDPARSALAMIDRQLERLVRLIDDLMDLSRISRSKLRLRREVVGLAELLDRVEEVMRPLIEGAGQTLEIGRPVASLHLDADPMRLQQVVMNLLDNAGKYSDRGGRIRLSAARDERWALIRVEDDGIGIPADQLTRVFEQFVQLEADAGLEVAAPSAADRSAQARTASRSGGLGIGLSLARSLVELHGGSIAAASAGPGQGSCFSVRLPLAELALETVGVSAPAALAERCGASSRVLVADDNPDVAESLRLVLTAAGYAVETVADGRSALAAAERLRPTAAVLDLGMPELDGDEVAGRLRARPWGRSLPLIAMTGWGHERARRRVREAGFDAHLIKPVKPDALLALLDRLIARRLDRSESEPPAP